MGVCRDEIIVFYSPNQLGSIIEGDADSILEYERAQHGWLLNDPHIYIYIYIAREVNGRH